MMNNFKIKEKATTFGADLCGIATIDKFTDAPVGFHPVDIFPECKSVIVVGVQFPHSALTLSTKSPYTFVRNMMVRRLDEISFKLACDLETNGIPSVPIPSAEPYDSWDVERRHGRGVLSLKHAGQLAGLGMIGKNTLLLNEKFGNMIWLGAVLTSAGLESDAVSTINMCPDKCRICLEACPQNALDGVTINQKLCRSRSISSTEGGGWVLLCNSCRSICPKHRGLH
jgi:epoxyqueuosine reductase